MRRFGNMFFEWIVKYVIMRMGNFDIVNFYYVIWSCVNFCGRGGCIFFIMDNIICKEDKVFWM